MHPHELLNKVLRCSDFYHTKSSIDLHVQYYVQHSCNASKLQVPSHVPLASF